MHNLVRSSLGIKKALLLFGISNFDTASRSSVLRVIAWGSVVVAGTKEDISEKVWVVYILDKEISFMDDLSEI